MHALEVLQWIMLLSCTLVAHAELHFMALISCYNSYNGCVSAHLGNLRHLLLHQHLDLSSVCIKAQVQRGVANVTARLAGDGCITAAAAAAAERRHSAAHLQRTCHKIRNALTQHLGVREGVRVCVMLDEITQLWLYSLVVLTGHGLYVHHFLAGEHLMLLKGQHSGTGKQKADTCHVPGYMSAPAVPGPPA
jgi:hypothetical protein